MYVMKKIIGYVVLFVYQLFFFASYGQKKELPNIIIILSDDQGWGDLGFNGNQVVLTPMLDKMAKNGVSFQHFYVSPVCSPTRAEFLTGRYHVRGGVSSTSTGRVRLDLDETTIAQIFKKQVIQRPPMENGIMEAKRLIILIPEDLMIFMDFVQGIGAIILIPFLNIMVKLRGVKDLLRMT